MSLRELILGAQDLPRVAVPTPEWEGTDGQVYVRGLTGNERDRYEIFLAHHQEDEERLREEAEPQDTDDAKPRVILALGTDKVRATIVAMGSVDVDGTRIFDDKDVALLGSKHAGVLDRLYSKIRELSGMDSDEREAAKNSDAIDGESFSID